MLTYPDINPVLVQLGPIQVHWYGVMYLLGFLAAWALATTRAKSTHGEWNQELVQDLLFYGMFGGILGGRIGYMFLYNYTQLTTDPASLFRIWEGGMSIHGGIIGSAIAVALFAHNKHKKFGEVSDFLVPLVPFGLGLGRIGNFINGELWGRVTDAPWGMVFPNADSYPRHPSQLYEFLLEGVLLFALVWWFSAKPRPRNAVTGLFFIAYGVFRCVAELFREPDVQIGYIGFDWLTMGQLLSLPMILIGSYLLWKSYRNPMTALKKALDKAEEE
jgi:phosphatidylglycerol:prolipoprotein diacylglycerol transferase